MKAPNARIIKGSSEMHRNAPDPVETQMKAMYLIWWSQQQDVEYAHKMENPKRKRNKENSIAQVFFIQIGQRPNKKDRGHSQ